MYLSMFPKQQNTDNVLTDAAHSVQWPADEQSTLAENNKIDLLYGVKLWLHSSGPCTYPCFPGCNLLLTTSCIQMFRLNKRTMMVLNRSPEY